MNVDTGFVIGIAGAVLATISIVYARSQALAQRRQVEEMQRQTEEIRRAQHFETSHTLMKDAIAARQDWVRGTFRKEWLPPAFITPFRQALGLLDGNVEALMKARVYIEYLQEMYFARKADLVADDHWHAMHRFMRGFFALEIDRKLFVVFADFGWLTDEFEKFGKDFCTTSVWTDPLDRLQPVHDLPIDKPREGSPIPPSTL